MKRKLTFGKLTAIVALVGTTSLTAQTTPAPQPAGICSRGCWGARAGSCTGTISVLNRAIIHHTAAASDWNTTGLEDSKSRVRGVQNYHMDNNGWCDVGYHFLFDKFGNIFEARAGSLGGSPWKRGAHDGCNTDSFGFTLLGYCHTPYNHNPDANARGRMYDTIAWRMPAGWSPYGSGSYCSVTVGRLDGHRKVKATACPGDVFFNNYIGNDYNGGDARGGVGQRRSPFQNPPYLFGGGGDGWVAGNSMTGLTWTDCCGWPGIIYGDQVGADAFIYGPAANFGGPGEGVVNVSVFAQNGSSAIHDMQLHYKTAAENFFDAAKASPSVGYSAMNAWVNVNLYVGGPKWTGQTINQLRLDFDANNQGTRWIVNHVVAQSSLRWHFPSSTMNWIAGNSVLAPWWTDCCGWPGIIVVDQTGNDASILSTGTWFDLAGPYKFIGAVNDRIRVRIYPQNGNTANHDMQVFWITNSDGTWTESKSVSATYVGQNQWVDVILPVGQNPAWSGGQIRELRLDFDQVNHGNRWIIDYIGIEH
jgi:hypothetical protein